VCFSVELSSGSGKSDVYLAREIWEEMHSDGSHSPGTGRLEVLLPGYGRYWLRFEWPVDDS
jgi:hypothetical protein